MTSSDFSKLGCVIMASGLGTRFGSNKLLAKLKGYTLIEHTIDTLKQAGLTNILVVTRSLELQQLVQRLNHAVLLHALPYQSDTVALGVKYWQSSKLSLEGLLFATGDQPLLKSETVQKLCQAYITNYQASPTPQMLRLAYQKDKEIIPGNPVIFSPQLWPELLQLPQDKGGAVLCRQYPRLVQTILVNPQELIDIDTQEDLQKVRILL